MSIPSRANIGRIAIILIAALGIRLVAGWWWQARLPPGSRFFFGDSESYWQLAQTIYHGQPYQFANDDARIFRTPGFPAVLGALFWVLRDGNPHVYWVRAWMAILGTVSVGGVIVIARQLFDAQVACVAGVLVSLYPESISLGTFILSEAAFCPCMLAQLASWLAAIQSQSRSAALGWALLGGGASGAAVLARPSWLLFVPFATMLGVGFAAGKKRTLGLGLVMAAAMCLTLVPWWIRNYQVAGSWVPTTLQVGASLYDGLSPTANGASDMRFAPRFVEQLRERDAREPDPSGKTFEERLDRWLSAESVAWSREHPADVLRLGVVKFLRIWSPWPNDQGFGSLAARWSLAASYIPLMVLASAGLWRNRHQGWPCVLCALPAGYFTLLHMVFVGSIRYRQPAMLTLTVFAAATLVEWWRWRANSRFIPAASKANMARLA